MEARLWEVREVYQEMKVKFDGYWIWLLSEEKPSYSITGKYAFFSEDKDKLIRTATNEIENHGYHKAKMNMRLLGGQTEHIWILLEGLVSVARTHRHAKYIQLYIA